MTPTHRPTKRKTAPPPPPPAPPPPPPAPPPITHGPGVRVLFVREAAARLGISRAQLEAMIARGQVETLQIELGCVVPTSEVERLQQEARS